MDITRFVKENGRPYSDYLSIGLRGDPDYFRWFLASLLYSKPIREKTATKTFLLFELYGMADPRAILSAGWDRIVEVLDEGGYTRYDFSTADRLLAISKKLVDNYGGSLEQLHNKASDPMDLEKRLRELGKGIGPTTVSVFLRDMRKVWSKADPKPTEKVKRAMSQLGISDLKELSEKEGLNLVELDTALHRYCKTTKC
jgi:endonuclease III